MTGTNVLDALAGAGFRGRLIGPGSPTYDEDRSVFNAMVDKRPAAIAQCEDDRDVALAVRHAREHGLEVAVRGGGHGVAGTALSDGGLVVDLRRLAAVSVSPEERTARVGGGATMAALDRASGAHGLAVTGGRVSTTGVGGFTLGGGSGWLERKLGLACENLLSVDLVTADGDRITASEDQHPDLFWALHGGGGNFGVATSFTFRLHPLPCVTVAMLLTDAEDSQALVEGFRDFVEAAPDEVGGAVIYLTGPPEEFVPDDLVGRLALLRLVTFAGPEEDARQVLRPLLGTARVEIVAEMPYADLQCMLDDPPGHRNYWSAEHLGALPDAAVERYCARAARMLVPSASQHVLFPGGGALARHDPGFPVPWRGASWTVHPFAVWSDPADDETAVRWTREARADMREWSTGAVYLNFIGDEGIARVQAGLGADNWRRLVEVKRRFDPDNVFHLNHNIDPAGAAISA